MVSPTVATLLEKIKFHSAWVNKIILNSYFSKAHHCKITQVSSPTANILIPELYYVFFCGPVVKTYAENCLGSCSSLPLVVSFNTFPFSAIFYNFYNQKYRAFPLVVIIKRHNFVFFSSTSKCLQINKRFVHGETPLPSSPGSHKSKGAATLM